MAYTPTVWVNNVAPPLSAANLNKLTDELESQASTLSISHSLPTWANGIAPALTDAAPLNEIERVTRAVALAVGLNYTVTTWESGWTPARNATRLNRIEVQVALNRDHIATPTLTFDWIGNTFSGQNYNHIGHGTHDLAVSSTGMAIVGTNWSESGHEIRLHDSTRVYGSRQGLHDGIGSRAVAINDTHLWAVHGTEIYRWTRSTFQGGDSFGGRLSLNTGFNLHGICVIGSELFVSDLSNVRVYPSNLSGGQIRSFAAPNARHLAGDRQGNLWVLRAPASGTAPLVTRYSLSGTQLANWTPTGYTVDIAADPTSDTILTCDNGQDQQIKKYSYTGVQTGTLGVQGGALAGPTPGLLGPQRFIGPRGVAVDSSGNIYVAQTGQPGVGALIWADDNLYGRFLHLDCYNPAGTRLWRHEGNMFVDVGEPSPDGSMFYGRELSYTRGGDGRYSTRAFTLDPFTNTTDGRIISSLVGIYETTHVREFGGRRFIVNMGSTGGFLRILRISGEIAVPACYIGGNPGSDYIKVEGMAQENRPGTFPDNIYGVDLIVDGAGDAWRIGENTKVVRYRLQGFTAAGNPIYNYANTDVWNLPSQLANIRRIEVVGSAVYLSGYAAGSVPPSGEFDQWKWCGNRIVKYPTPPVGGVWPTPTWNQAIHYGPPSQGAGTDHPLTFCVSGSKIAVGYQKDPTANSGYLRIYSSVTGVEERAVRAYSGSSGVNDFPAAYGEIGWLDMHRSLTFVGGMIWMEDNQLSKQVGVLA